MNSSTLEIAVPAILILVAILACKTLLSGKKADPRGPVYNEKPLMTKWEKNFFKEIEATIPQPFACFTQVRYADFLSADSRYSKEEKFALNKKIFGKSADFVIYNKSTGRVALVYELNDKTHSQANRKERDQIIASALKSASIPLIVIKPGQHPDIRKDLSL